MQDNRISGYQVDFCNNWEKYFDYVLELVIQLFEENYYQTQFEDDGNCDIFYFHSKMKFL